MSLRDYLWDYPVALKKLYITLIPISHIILFTLVAILFFSLLFTPNIFKQITFLKKDTFVEGVLGTKENLNPLFLTTNQVDRDLQSLIFTKLFTLDSEGFVKPSLAKSWTVSNDLKTYNIVLDDGYYWQDGVKLTADDVVFTINFAKELNTKYNANTFGQAISTLNVAKTGDYSLKVMLSDVNATVFEMLSIYIVPKHILENTNLESYAFTRFSQFPIGSGPYMVDSTDNDSVHLVKNSYYNKNINISFIEFKFFATLSELENAFKANLLDGVGTYNKSDFNSISEYSKNFNIIEYQLPFRKKVIFFNTRDVKFANKGIRKGILYLLDKQKLITDLKIDGKLSNTSIPTPSWAYQKQLFSESTYSPTKAIEELKSAGYTKNPTNGYYTSSDGKILSVSLTYLDNDFNERLANMIVVLLEKEGVLVNLLPKSFDQITRETLASRDFELILYEIEVSIDPDQYNIWHSLKIDYPNLNISGFKNNRLDVYLERGRQLNDRNQRLENYSNFQKLLLNEVPAIFLYEPNYSYIIRSNIQNTKNNEVKYPYERFDNIINWNIN